MDESPRANYTFDSNHTLAGDCLRTNTSFREAVPQAMMPLAWSMRALILDDCTFLPGHATVSNIAGLPYLKISIFATVFRFLGIGANVGASLSLAAIVVRELGYPVAAGCGDVAKHLKTGKCVRVDRARGIVEVIG